MTTALMALSLPLRVGIKATLLPSSSNHEPQLIFSTYNISSIRSAMALRIKTSLLLLLFLLISSLSSGELALHFIGRLISYMLTGLLRVLMELCYQGTLLP